MTKSEIMKAAYAAGKYDHKCQNCDGVARGRAVLCGECKAVKEANMAEERKRKTRINRALRAGKQYQIDKCNNEREKEIVTMRISGHTLETIAHDYDISRERVRQILEGVRKGEVQD